MPNLAASELSGKGITFGSAVATGVGANTNISCPGISKNQSVILSMIQFPPPNDTGTVGAFDRTGTAVITADDTVQNTVATNSPANSVVHVTWYTVVRP